MTKNIKYINIILMLISLAACLFMLEIGFRMSKGRLINSGFYLFSQPGDESWKWWKILRESADKELSYEHIPGSEAYVFNSAIKINSLGFRDNEYPEHKTKGVTRIVGVGDSIMFGWRVPLEDIYLKVLENELNKTGSAEVINCSVPGYNTEQECALAKKLAQKLDPDIVIMGFFINDVYDPAYILWKGKYLVSEKVIEHYEKNRNILKHIHRFLINHVKIYDYLVSRIKKKSSESKSENIVLKEEDWRRVEPALININDYLKSKNIRFIVFYIPSQQELLGYSITNPPNENLKRICVSNNIEFCSAFNKMSDEKDKSGIYIENDGHLTKRGHGIAADAIKGYLYSTKQGLR